MINLSNNIQSRSTKPVGINEDFLGQQVQLEVASGGSSLGQT